MEPRLIDANDQVLWRLSVVLPDGHRYIPWEALAEVPTAEVAVCSNMDGGTQHGEAEEA